MDKKVTNKSTGTFIHSVYKYRDKSHFSIKAQLFPSPYQAILGAARLAVNFETYNAFH